MDIGSIFLILALLMLAAMFISRPLIERERPQEMLQIKTIDHERSALLAERDRILNALQELDFDYALGKIPEEDYPTQRTRLVQMGADVLRKLDELMPQPAHQDAEARLEAAIAARRADSVAAQGTVGNGRKPTAAAIAAPDDRLEALLADRRRERREKAGGFCAQCGGPVQKSDRFCPKCGVKIV